MKIERMSKSEVIFKIISYTLIGVFALLALYPLIYAFSVSISGKVAYETGQIILWPKEITFKAYGEVIKDGNFWISYTNTLYYTVFGTAWSMIISLTGAYALSKSKLLFRSKWNFLIVFTMWFSVGIIPQYLNYMSMGVNNRIGMIVAFGVQAYNIILLRNSFSSVPTEIEEAALVDGANEFVVFAKIYVPMSKAAIATVTLFYAISRWNGYYWASVLIKDSLSSPLQVYLRLKIDDFQKLLTGNGTAELPYAADSLIYAIIICSIIPVLIIYPFIQKYFARGVNMGGVKG